MSLKHKADVVLELLERGGYQTVDGRSVSIADAQRAACAGSLLYTPGQLAALCSARRDASEGAEPESMLLEMRNATTQVAARDLAGSGTLLLLNFASARRPGGGFLTGAKAQEEDLCRCSGLYPTLLLHPAYYEANRKTDSLLYTDHMIFSPAVPFFKTRGTGELLDEPFHASVVTAPAPNTGPYLRRQTNEKDRRQALDDLERTFERRWDNVFAIAADQQCDTVLLGAWGCGAFGGDPTMSARAVLRASARWAGSSVAKAVFAIPNKGKRGRVNYEAFANAIGATASIKPDG